MRMHLIEPPGSELPSIEGILVSRRPEYVLGVPVLHTTTDSAPIELEARHVVIPRERIAFYEEV